MAMPPVHSPPAGATTTGAPVCGGQTGYSPRSPGSSSRRLSASTVPAGCDRQPLTGPLLISAGSSVHLPGPLPLPQALPTEVLYRIFCYLPAAARHQCALVCRHWYTSQPGTDMRALARWVVQRPPLMRAAGEGLALGYSSRAYPFLQRQACEQLPELLRQHRQAAHSFPGLLQYSLVEQRCGAPQLTLEPVAIDWKSRVHASSADFSPCGRWLAVKCHPARKTDSACIKIYGWRNNSWHTESVPPGPQDPPSGYTFCLKPAATMISAHGWEIMAWRKAPTQAHWTRTCLHRQPRPYAPCLLHTTPDGDLLVLCGHGGQGQGALLLFFRYTQDNQRWQKLSAHAYVRTPDALSWNLSTDYGVALGLATPAPEAGFYENLVHVWRRNRTVEGSPVWSCQSSTLHISHAALQRIKTSPDGRHLLILLSHGRVCLLAVDAQHRLPEEQYIDCGLSPARPHMPCFQADSQQLVVPLSRWELMLMAKSQDGHWGQELLIKLPSLAGDLLQTPLLAMQLSGDGRTLTRICSGQVDIYAMNGASDWQRLVKRQIENIDDPAPLAAFLPPDNIHCATVSGPRGDLWIHGPDSNGHWIQKASFRVGKPVSSLLIGPDGLSLVLECRGTPPILFQLTGGTGAAARLSPRPQNAP
ncbi:MAG: F-box protein [Kistimonas sp.]|nr:F-box protein [Kistimonas sp.]